VGFGGYCPPYNFRNYLDSPFGGMGSKLLLGKFSIKKAQVFIPELRGRYLSIHLIVYGY
jgi:hypothetical protein